MNVLHVCANPRPIEESASKQMAAAFFRRLIELNPEVNVTNADLYHNPPPFLSYEAFRYFWNPVLVEGYEPNDKDRKASDYAVSQCKLLKDADVLVLTMPMWCNTMPAIMKAWIDQVIMPGETFQYGPEGTIPMHKLKKVILLISSAGTFSEDDPDDGLTPALRATFNYIGVTDVAVAWADGQDRIRFPDHEARKQVAIEASEELAEEVAELSAPA